MKEKQIWPIINILAAIGIVLAFYLFYSFISPNPPEVCYINQSVNCDAVTKGSLSSIFGIPVSLIGLLGYVTILFAGLKKHKRLALGMSSFGMLFCLRLTYLEIFVEKVLCPVCVACQIVMLALFILALKLNIMSRTSKSEEKEDKT